MVSEKDIRSINWIIYFLNNPQIFSEKYYKFNLEDIYFLISDIDSIFNDDIDKIKEKLRTLEIIYSIKLNENINYYNDEEEEIIKKSVVEIKNIISNYLN